MKKIHNLFFTIISIVSLSSFSLREKQATIILNIKHKKNVAIKLSINNLINSNPIYLINTNTTDNKSIKTKVSVNNPTFGFLEINGESTPIIIYPNNITIINYNQNGKQISFSFDGNSKNINNALFAIDNKLNHIYNNPRFINFNQKIEPFLKTLDSLKFELTKYVDTISKDFKLNSEQILLIKKKTYLRNEVVKKNYFLINQNYYSLFDTKHIDSIENNCLYFDYRFPEIFILLEWEFSFKFLKPLIQTQKLNKSDSVTNNLPNLLFQKLKLEYKSKPQAEVLYAKNINVFINRYGYSNVLDSLFNIFKQTFPNSLFISPLTEEFYRSKDFIKNMELPKFLITSYDNKKYSIKDFNGKIIYIDIWATWCTPCINQIPNLNLLQRKLESRNIIFLTISIDDDIAAWRDFIKKNPQYKGNHFIYINDRFNNFLSLNSLLNITSIPRYIIIDTNGRIHSINAESPESQNLFKELLELTE